MSISNARPIQTRCQAPSCRRALNIPASALHYVIMPNKHGGTHKDAGYSCPACGNDNVVPAALLPKGLLGDLPPAPSAAGDRAPPIWIVGAEARKHLQNSIIDLTIDPDTHAIVIARSTDGSLTSLSPQGILDRDIDMTLRRLDANRCTLVVISGRNGESVWRMIFDPVAGVAGLVEE